MILRIAFGLALLTGIASHTMVGTTQSFAASCGDQKGGCDFGNSNGGSGGIKGGIRQHKVQQLKE